MPISPNVSPDKPLTVKQQKFAADVAAGMTKSQARKNHYRSSPPGNPKYVKNDRRKAADLAKQPNVAAEIRRLTWLACPPADDIRGMREHGIRVLSDLSRTAASEEVRLKSALALIQIAEHTRAAADPAVLPADQDRIMGALRQLYGQAQLTASRQPQGYQPPPVPHPGDDEVIDIRALAPDAPADAPKP